MTSSRVRHSERSEEQSPLVRHSERREESAFSYRVVAKSLKLALVFALASCILFAATQPAVTKLLPDAKDKPLVAWKAVKNGLQYGKGDGLTNIYDGGYGDYIKAGVVDAARNLYQRKADTMEVTVHTMKSAKAAAAFFAKDAKANKAKTFSQTKTSAGAVGYSAGQALGYGYSGSYYVAVTSMYGGAKARADAQTFVKVIINKAAKAK